MAIHNCSPNTWKAEATGSGSSHISLENKLKASSDYIRPCCGVGGGREQAGNLSPQNGQQGLDLHTCKPKRLEDHKFQTSLGYMAAS